MNGEYYEPILLPGIHQAQEQKMCLQRTINPSQMIMASITDYVFVPSMYFIKTSLSKAYYPIFMAF